MNSGLNVMVNVIVRGRILMKAYSIDNNHGVSAGVTNTCDDCSPHYRTTYWCLRRANR